MRKPLLLLLSLVLTIAVRAQDQAVRVGIFTDAQYCDCPPGNVRQYRKSPAKIDSCIRHFNTLPLDAVFHLGDMIDHDWNSYDRVLEEFRKSKAPLYPVIGNHDFIIGKSYRDSVAGRLGLESLYYRVDLGNWSFIILNGMDLSYFAPQSKKQRNERNEMVATLFGSLRFNGMIWNGGIGQDQMQWLDNQLTDISRDGRRAVILCHFPLKASHDHTLFNNREMLAYLQGKQCVKAWFSGHYHPGGYFEAEGLHLLNFKGMVDTEINAYSIVTLTADSILVEGHGREPDRRLRIRK